MFFPLLKVENVKLFVYFRDIMSLKNYSLFGLLTNFRLDWVKVYFLLWGAVVRPKWIFHDKRGRGGKAKMSFDAGGGGG